MEGKLLSGTLLQLAAEKQLSRAGTELLKDNLALLETLLFGLGMCVSEEDDLLSQWRGYANDASGFALGFATNYLRELGEAENFSLVDIVYEPKKQRDMLEPAFDDMTPHIASLSPRGLLWMTDQERTDLSAGVTPERIKQEQEAFWKKLFSLSFSMYRLKTNAFKEELEWRLVALSPTQTYKGAKRSFETLYRCDGARVIPYREVKLEPLSTGPIVDVVLGPKNQTPVDVICRFLRDSGFDVQYVRQSVATYR